MSHQSLINSALEILQTATCRNLDNEGLFETVLDSVRPVNSDTVNTQLFLDALRLLTTSDLLGRCADCGELVDADTLCRSEDWQPLTCSCCFEAGTLVRVPGSTLFVRRDNLLSYEAD